jgi:hypothetical protein
MKNTISYKSRSRGKGKNKKVVYTCITNNYDTLKEPPKDYLWDYICFTDNPNLKSDLWEIIVVSNLDHKYPKLRPDELLPDYDIWLWIDGSVDLKVEPSDLLAYLDIADICTFKAKLWSCAYIEANTCMKLWGDDIPNILDEIDFLKSEEYPTDNGLSCGTMFIRRNTENIIKMNELWEDMILQYSRRDQISFNYCMWKFGIKENHFPGSVYSNPVMDWRQNHG